LDLPEMARTRVRTRRRILDPQLIRLGQEEEADSKKKRVLAQAALEWREI